MRLIDADALLDKVVVHYCKDCERRKGIKGGKLRVLYEIGGVPCLACGVGDVTDEIEDAPTIEPERKRWIYPSDVGGFGRCPYCKALFEYVLINGPFFNFCPRCGNSVAFELEGEQ